MKAAARTEVRAAVRHACSAALLPHGANAGRSGRIVRCAESGANEPRGRVGGVVSSYLSVAVCTPRLTVRGGAAFAELFFDAAARTLVALFAVADGRTAIRFLDVDGLRVDVLCFSS